MEVLVLLFVVGAMIVVPVLILGAFLKVVAAVILLPFKVIAVLFKGFFGIVGGLLGAVGAAIGIVFGGFGLLLGLLCAIVFGIFLPLMPLLLLGLVVWVALKAASPAPRSASVPPAPPPPSL